MADQVTPECAWCWARSKKRTTSAQTTGGVASKAGQRYRQTGRQADRHTDRHAGKAHLRILRRVDDGAVGIHHTVGGDGRIVGQELELLGVDGPADGTRERHGDAAERVRRGQAAHSLGGKRAAHGGLCDSQRHAHGRCSDRATDGCGQEATEHLNGKYGWEVGYAAKPTISLQTTYDPAQAPIFSLMRSSVNVQSLSTRSWLLPRSVSDSGESHAIGTKKRSLRPLLTMSGDVATYSDVSAPSWGVSAPKNLTMPRMGASHAPLDATGPRVSSVSTKPGWTELA
ncbi:hypothetical protein BC831DRAFT_244463 [Entophlyctis helioformis]|nr:hypothetical protein BC831DRAFT_244463 [Entophlyctis helioformis]